MKLGLVISTFSNPGGPSELRQRLMRLARAADDAGLASLWVMDHLLQIELWGTHADDPLLESYTTLGYLAATTNRVQLGTLVTAVTFRHPAHLAKIVTTLDVLSGGRAVLGIGAAGNEREHPTLGIPLPPIGERFERLEETVNIVLQMWSGQRAPFRGKYYHLEQTLTMPGPLRRPRPPLLIGGSGERKTLRLVAKYADACNLFGIPAAIPNNLRALREHCSQVGRTYDDIEKTATLPPVRLSRHPGSATTTPDAFLESLRGYASLGIEHCMVSLADPWDPDQIELLGTEVVPRAAIL